jgi:hypothetical protein
MLNPEQIQLASNTVRELRVALSNFFLYAAGNNMTLLSIQRFLGGLDGLFKTLPSVTLGESEGRLVLEGTPLDERTTGSTNMIKDLFLTHKIHSLTFFKGVETEEAKTLFSLLKPRALPTGLSFSQALVQQSLDHIRANEKVFVAVAEGEVVVSAEAAAQPQVGQNLQDALEALQYFLQIFARVKPDSNKQEVARKLMDHMGSWLSTEGGERATPEKARAWTEVLGGFKALKNGLENAQKPGDLKNSKLGMEELLRKFVALGESQGVALEEGDGVIYEIDTTPSGQVPPLEKDPVSAAIDEGRVDVFWDPNLEEMADSHISQIQEPDQMEKFESLWTGLWGKIASGDENTQALCLRHLNRLQWNQIPRASQLEGLRNLRQFLSETRRPAVYPIGLSLAQDWVPLEMIRPDWIELLEMVKLLRQLSEKKPPSFDKQNLAAKVALETIFCEPILDSLMRRYQAGADGPGILKIFTTLGPRVSPFLFEKIEKEPVESPDWKRAAGLLDALQTGGNHVYELWLEWPEKREYLDKFLEIFKLIPPTAEMEDYFQRHWNTFNPAGQAKLLDIAGQWKKSGFRPMVIRLLDRPDTPAATQALEVLSKIGREGDAKAIAEAVKKYPAGSKDREAFWVKACQTMGELADLTGAEILMEWADKYKLMENKKNRSLEVRRAAMEALGHFRSKTVADFLAGLQKDAEKELRPTIDQAIVSAGQK